MAESGLQPWMQWRLLQPIEANLVEGDLERWGQWWHEKDGQAFWHSCEWLWHTLGQRAIDALILHIETALGETDLHSWVQQWKKGDRKAFLHVWQWLWEELSPWAIRFVYKIAKKEDYGLVAKGFDAAFEELDLMVSGGKLLTKPADGIDWDKRRDVPKKVITLATGRKLGMRKPFEWRGADSFKALFRDMWSARCRDALRRVPAPPIPIDPTPEDNSEGQQCAYEEELPSAEPYPATLVLESDTVIELVDALAQVAEQLDFAGKPNLAAVPKQLILYAKRKVAETNLASLGFSETRLQDQQLLTELLSVVQDRDIEDLLDLTNAQHIEFDGEETWDFVQSTLSLKRDALYKRRQRFFDTLSTLPQVPEILHAVVALLWLKDMKNWDKDCHETAERLRQHGDENRAHLLHLIKGYLRWTFAQAYPIYRQRSLDWVLNTPPEELFKANNPALLAPSYPNAGDFQRFVTRFFPERHGLLAELPSLQEAIDKLGEPRPIRLVKLIKALLHEKDSDDKEPTEE